MLGQAVAPIGPDGVEQTVPVPVSQGVHLQQRPVDELADHEHGIDVWRCRTVSATQQLGRVGQPERSGEDRQCLEGRARGAIQHLVAPRHRRRERLLSWIDALTSVAEDREPIRQPSQQLGWCEHVRARRGELERERQAIEPTADLGDGPDVLGREREAGLRRASPLDEQADRLERTCRRDVGVDRRLGRGEWRHRPTLLTRNPQRLSARRQDTAATAGLEQRPDQPSDRLGHALAVVEDDQHLAIAQVVDDHVGRIATRLIADAEHAHQVGRHRFGLRSGELDAPDAVSVATDLLGRDLEGETRLAHTARTGERHQPMRSQQAPDLGDVVVAADQARHRGREVVRCHLERSQGWEVALQSRVQHLGELDGLGQIPQAVRTEVAERHLGGHAGEVGTRGSGDDDLAPVRGGTDAGGSVDDRSVVVAA